MDHRGTVTLKDGTRCLIRTGTAEDAPQMLNEFLTELGKTEFLRWYPDEKSQDVAEEVAFLQSRAEDPRAVGFREVGTVPRGFHTRDGRDHDLVLMWPPLGA